MPERMQVGLRRYGTLLQPFNGRNYMQDAWEELLDLSVYLEGVRREREALIGLLQRVRRMSNCNNPDIILVQQDVTSLLRSMGED
jgi:hypothetical protein